MHFVSCTNDLREYLDIAGAKNINFSNISTDTRSISKDALFIAIKGPNFDGNKFIDQALDNGAVAVLTSDTQYKKNTNPACIYVPSVKEALIQIATRICDEFKGKKILITGSNGKTTCTFLLSNSLPNCSSTIGNFNNEIGLPLSVMQADRDSEYLVLEAGAGKPGDIAILSEIVKPHLGLITSISESHTEFLGDIKGVFKEKTSMLKFIQDNGILILSFKKTTELARCIDALSNELYKLFWDKCPRYVDIISPDQHMLFPNEESYESELGRESFAGDLALFDDLHFMMGYLNYSDDLSMMEFSYNYYEKEIYARPPGELFSSGIARRAKKEVFSSLLVGYHNMQNIILVARCLRHLAFYENKVDGPPYKEFNHHVNKLESFLVSDQIKSFNRSQHSKWLNGSHLINDSYNANPASVKAAIGVLSHAPPNVFKRRILLLGDMLELDNPAESHGDIGDFILENFFSEVPEIEKRLKKPDYDNEFHFYHGYPDDMNVEIRKVYEENPDLLYSYTYGRINRKNTIDVLITFGDLACKIADRFKEFGKDIKCYSFCSDKEEDKLKTFLNDFIQKDDIVLLKGSRGMRMERFI